MHRAATQHDAEAVEWIVAEAYAPYIPRIGREPAPMAVDHRASSLRPAACWWPPTRRATPVGVLVIVVGTDHVLVESVAVARSAQGRGLDGRLLLGHAEQQARQLGLREVRLYANAAMTENLAMYPHLGYVEVNRRTEDGFDWVYFLKDLLHR